MEWLLVIWLNMPMERASIEDMRYPTYDTCIKAADRVLSGELRPVYFKEPLIQKKENANVTLAVIYKKIGCIEVDTLPRDDAALTERKLLAKQGDAKAQFKLGMMYKYGRWVPQDDKEAAKWIKLAAEQDHADAQYNLGMMYNKGKGVSKNYKEAIRWLRLAIKHGYESAARDLGQITTDELIQRKIAPIPRTIPNEAPFPEQ